MNIKQCPFNSKVNFFSKRDARLISTGIKFVFDFMRTIKLFIEKLICLNFILIILILSKVPALILD